MRRGRPTKNDQFQIRRILRPYYQKSISANATSKETGINIKTVLRYFKEWDQKLLESEDKDFLKRCKITKEKSIQTIDDELISLNHQETQLDFVIHDTKRSGNVLHFEKLSRLKLKIKDLKTKLLVAKINLVNTPTADTIINMNKGDENESG